MIIKNNRLSRREQSQIRKEITDLSRMMKRTEAPVTPLKKKVLSLVAKYRKDIEEEDLPRVRAYLKTFFDAQPGQPYYRVMDLREETEDNRLVIIGDTHCDFPSLCAIFEKLALSEYDYFEKATFIFLGDYLDRGAIFFEYIMLLAEFKTLLGSRCILMKGNHELIRYEEASGQLESLVYPANTCPLLNDYCGEDKEFLRKFASYFSHLPYYILLKTRKGTDLLVHGGIPRDMYLDRCSISPETGEMLVDGDILSVVLDNMIWSDPRHDARKIQGGSSRFEFGREQFEAFAERSRVDRLFRSHEPVENGMEAYYDGRLYTIFSNGGAQNAITGYPDVVNPVFAIFSAEGDVRFESVYFKKFVAVSGLSTYSTVLYNGGPATDIGPIPEVLHLNEEFYIINK